MTSARENLANGKYVNQVPYPRASAPPDRENLTGKQVREHKDNERYRRLEERAAWSAGERTARELLRSDLEIEHSTVGNSKADKLWALAWDRGHDSGYADVISAYEELTELVVAL